MKRKSNIYRLIAVCVLALLVLVPSYIAAFATEALDGKITITDTQGKVSVNGTTATVQAYAAKKVSATNTITITNNSDSNAQISFSWQSEQSNDLGGYSVTVNGEQESKGSYSNILEPSESITIEIVVEKRNLAGNTVTLTLSNLAYEVVAASYKVTVNTSGSGTISTTATKNDNGSYAVSPIDGTIFTATAAEGYTFIGWTDENSKLISSSAEYTCKPSVDMTVKAVFADPTEEAWFYVDSAYLCHLSTAFDKGTTAVLAASGTLKNATSYTVPSGKKLLIPYSASDSGDFDDDPSGNNYSESALGELYATDSSKAHYAYRTLTVATGVSIECYGSINVNGERVYVGQPNTGVSAGGYGKIILGQETKDSFSEDNLKAQLTIYKGGVLYCYGYITGTGMVDVQSGGKTYELMQICDWPGGKNALAWYGTSKENFLVTAYYVQNIEAAVRYSYGANAYCCYISTMNAPVLGETKASGAGQFISTGTGGMFQMDEGAGILRTYDHTIDRVYYHTYGAVSVGSVSVKVSIYSLSSGDYVLPVPYNYSIVVENGSTMTIGTKLALLPDAEINIKSGGTVELTSELYIWDVKDWSNNYFYHEQVTCNSAPVPYVATLNSISPRATRINTFNEDGTWNYGVIAKTLTSGGKLNVDGKLTVSDGGVLATTTGGSTNNCITGTGSIELNSTETGSLTAGYSSGISTISTDVARGNLAGLNLASFPSTGTYNCVNIKGTNYWYIVEEKVAATCTEPGGTKYYCVDSSKNVFITGDAAKGHSYGQPTWSWTEYSAATATFTCTTCGEQQVVSATITSTTTQPTTEADGQTVYTATVSFNGETYTDSKTVTIPKLVTYSVKISWSQTDWATYTEGTTTYKWDAENLTWKSGEPTGQGWSGSSVVNVTVENGVNSGTVYVSFDFTPAKEGGASMSAVEQKTVNAGQSPTYSLTITPSGTPEKPAEGQNITLGTITITLTKGG